MRHAHDPVPRARFLTITGRTVLAFLSDNHMDPDIAVESFVLVPQNGDGTPPTTMTE